MAKQRSLHRVIPNHFRSPVALAARLVMTRNAAAYSAMAYAALGALLTPLDVLLSRKEQQLYKTAGEARPPLVFVVGPPRSGTTICEQTLLRHLPFAYLNNVTSLFPRSPLMACRWFGGPLEKLPATTTYYGKTYGLRSPNDALYLWDRWLGSDRTVVPTELTAEADESLRRFFAACEGEFQRPMLNKCNNLVATAHLSADALPNSYFICMQRNATCLAQSLYRARLDITGSLDRPYGLCSEEFMDADPIVSVAKQVRFYEDLVERQQAVVGSDRFWVVSYEAFCRDPGELVRRVAREILEREDLVPLHVDPLEARTRTSIEQGIYQKLVEALAESGLAESAPADGRSHGYGASAGRPVSRKRKTDSVTG